MKQSIVYILASIFIVLFFWSSSCSSSSNKSVPANSLNEPVEIDTFLIEETSSKYKKFVSICLNKRIEKTEFKETCFRLSFKFKDGSKYNTLVSWVSQEDWDSKGCFRQDIFERSSSWNSMSHDTKMKVVGINNGNIEKLEITLYAGLRCETTLASKEFNSL